MTRKGKLSKERGFWLTLFLIIVLLVNIIKVIAIRSILVDATWMTIYYAVAIITILAAFLIWFWKKWGLYLYVGATVVSMIVGLIASGMQLIVFYEIIPLAILGWLIREKYKYFE